MRQAPKKWINKVAGNVRRIAKKMKVNMSEQASKTTAKKIWSKLKPACKTKAIEKYG